jgi:DNA-binding winged helix-turn-helix (wHTH) protein
VLFGPFEYDESSGELRKHGTRIRLQGQPLQILTTLLRRPGQPVSREEFQQELWQGSTFGDFDHGLNAAVNRLRQVLGDSADQPRYIETLPGRGYRFIAPVEIASPKVVPELPSLPVREETEALTGQPALKRASRKWWIAAVALIAGVAIGYIATRSTREQPLLAPLRFTVAPPSGYVFEPATSRQSFALSPDGSKLAFTAMDGAGLFSVFVRDFRTLEPRLMPHSSGAHSVF